MHKIKDKINVLIIGGGGREHALAWKISKSPRIARLFVSPGNGGTKEIAENVKIKIGETKRLLQFALKNKIDLTVVGPDNPLADGIVDIFKKKGLRIFGPTKAAAKIEWSKAFAKDLMLKAKIPTAKFKTFKDYSKALAYIKKQKTPIVVKASGLAFGHGVYICETREKARMAISKIMLKKIHKDAGREVVIEEFLQGPEFSIHAFSDGKTFRLCPPSQDHKPIGEGNKGKNTGGMGTIAPLSWITKKDMQVVDKKVVSQTLLELKKHGAEFTGLLYPGLKMTQDGMKVLEFNARFGDPETQSYMRLLKTDLLDILVACADQRLTKIKIEWSKEFAVCIVLASGGYPDKYRVGLPISGIGKAEKIPLVMIFHAGTKFDEKDNKLKTSGGRVLNVTTTGKTLRQALNRAYKAVKLIHFKNMYYRRDIGSGILTR